MAVWLVCRQQTGVGQKIDCSLMETQLACLANIGQNWLLGAVNETRRWCDILLASLSSTSLLAMPILPFVSRYWVWFTVC